MKKNEKFILSAEAFYKNESRDNYENMISALRETEFLLPIKGINTNNKTINKTNFDIKNNNLFLLFTESGQTFIPIFTDTNEMKKWNKKSVNTFKFNFDEMYNLISKPDIEAEGITINSFSNNLTLDFNKMKTLIDRDKNIEDEVILSGTKNTYIENKKKLIQESERLYESLDIVFIDLVDNIKQIAKKYSNISEIYASHLTGFKEDKILIYIDKKGNSESKLNDFKQELSNIFKYNNLKSDIEIIEETSFSFKEVHRIKNRIYKKKRFLFF